MSKLARAIEILEAINNFYNEGHQYELSGHALILDDDSIIADAIAECIGGNSESTSVLPVRLRRRYGYHKATGWSGWIGKTKVREFVDKEEAIKWVNQQC